MLKTYLILFCFILTVNSFSQNLKVIDNNTSKPLQFVTITSQNSNASAVTNPKGEAPFSPFKNADTLIFQLTGYQKIIRTVDEIKKDNYLIKMSEKVYTLGEVLVQGRNPSNATPNLVGTIDLIKFREFFRSNDMYLTKTLDLVPGVRMQVRSTTSQSNILIRGIGGKSRFNERDVKIYYDGIPLTDADGTTSLNEIDFTSLGKIEVIKGSSGGLYGSSIGGVINLFSKRAHFQEKDFNQIVLAGSYGLLTSTTNFRSGTENSNYFANYSYQFLNGYRDHSVSNKKIATFGGDFFVSDAQTISLFINYAHVNDQFPGEIDSVDFYKNPTKANQAYIDKKIGSKSNGLLVGVSNIYKITSNFENTSSIFTGQDFIEAPIEPFYARNENTKMGLRSVFSYKPEISGIPVSLAFGGEMIRNFNLERHYNISPSGVQGAINADNEYDLRQYNLFAQGVADFTPMTNLIVSSGFSWSHYDFKDNFNLDAIDHSGLRNFKLTISPGVSIHQKLDENNSVYAQVNTGFSPPTVSEISNRDGSVNFNLKPETSITYEAGSYGSFFNDDLEYQLSLFYLKLNNSFIPQTLQNGFTEYVNAGSSDNKGIEAELSYKLISNNNNFVNQVRPFVNFSYNNFKYDNYVSGGVDYSGNYVPGIAPTLLNAGLDITTTYGFYFYATYNFVGKRYLNDNNVASDKAYSLLGAKFGFRRRIEHSYTLQFYVGVDNLTDTRYSPTLAVNQKSLSERGLPVYYNPAPGRNFYGAFNFEWHF